MRGPCSIEPATGGSEWYRAGNGRLALMEWVLTLSTAAALAIALGLRLCHLVLPTMQTIAVALSSTGAR